MPKRALTDAAVKRFKPPETGQVDIFDQGYPGLALRISYGGRKAWVCFYRLGGPVKRITLGVYPEMTLAGAREAWRRAREQAAAGSEPVKPQDALNGVASFESALENWLKRDQGQNRTVDAIKRLIDKDATPVWKHRNIADIGRGEILEVIDGVVDRGSPITARRLHAHLHRFFSWQTGRGNIPVNPMAHMPKPGAETKGDRVLSDAELGSLWEATGELGWPFGDLIRLLLLTGARRSEIGALRWSEIEGQTIVLDGARTKNNEPHIIPLSARAIAILGEIPRIAQSDLVFTTNGTTPVSGWSKMKTESR